MRREKSLVIRGTYIELELSLNDFDLIITGFTVHYFYKLFSSILARLFNESIHNNVANAFE